MNKRDYDLVAIVLAAVHPLRSGKDINMSDTSPDNERARAQEAMRQHIIQRLAANFGANDLNFNRQEFLHQAGMPEN